MTFAETTLKLHRDTPKPRRTLLVDVDADLAKAFAGEEDFIALPRLGKKPEEMWALSGKDSLTLVVMSKQREPKELFRDLDLAAHMVAPGGRILYQHDVPRAVTSTFVKIHPDWVTTPTNEFIRPRIDKKRVICLSLFDADSRYWNFLPAYIRAHHALFPGYELRIVHDDGVFTRASYGGALLELADCGLVKLTYVPSRPGQGKCERMLLRLLPAWEDDVDFVFARDVDSLPTWRERCVVEEEIAAGKLGEADLFTISDNVSHAGIMGGLCGVRADALHALWPTFDAFIAAAGFDDAAWACHGADQAFLNAVVAPKMKVLEHCTFQAEAEDGSPIVRTATVPNIAHFETAIIPFDDPRVPVELREKSNEFVNYMGAAHAKHDEAEDFYANEAVGSAETMAYSGSGDYPIAVFSSDMNPDYAFFLPFTALLWTERSFKPLVFLIGNLASWRASEKHRAALEATRRFGGEVHFVECLPGYKTATAAQVVRILGCWTPGVHDDDYLLTGDVDMLPLGPWIGSKRDESKDLQLYYANAYKFNHVQYPMCYMGAKAKIWREIVHNAGGSATLDDILALLPGYLGRFPESDREARTWDFDERVFAEMLQAWSGYPDRCQKIDRTFTKGEWRIDRSDWDGTMSTVLEHGSLDKVADAHCIRPGFGANWVRLRPLIALAAPMIVEWADEYEKLWRP